MQQEPTPSTTLERSPGGEVHLNTIKIEQQLGDTKITTRDKYQDGSTEFNDNKSLFAVETANTVDLSEDEVFGVLIGKILLSIPQCEEKDELKIDVQQRMMQTRKKIIGKYKPESDVSPLPLSYA